MLIVPLATCMRMPAFTSLPVCACLFVCAVVVVNSSHESPRLDVSRFRSAQSMTIPLSV